MPRSLAAIAALVLSTTLLTSSGITLSQDAFKHGPSPEELADAISWRNEGRDRGVLVTNVALHKPAKQIDTYDSRGAAGNAVDGNTDGNYNSKSTTHTTSKNEAWWEVDLVYESRIFTVHIFNRVDCCKERLTNFDVELYDYTHQAVSSVRYGSPPRDEYGFAFSPSVVARYVRVKLRQKNYLSLAEVKVFGTVVGGHQNVARGKSATQSSTYSHSANPIASKAVDGNTDGNFRSASTTHTNRQANPWWQVDLGKQYQITDVTLWNRIDCCGDRLDNFRLILSDDGVNAVKTFMYSSGGKELLSFAVNPPTGARYVKVRIIGVQYLQLAEVQVFTEHLNLALHKTAIQSSSTHNTVAGFAVDGNADGNFRAGSVTHTNNNARQWWEVDLGHQSEITSVSLYNRIDCCRERLTNFEVQLFDYAHSFVTKASQGSDVKTVYEFNFPQGTIARHVRVQLLGSNYLSLAEVEVYGTPLGGFENIALNKQATQSSTYSHSANPVAGKAVDGGTSGIFSDASTTHTNKDAGAWWEVDLGSEFDITDVTIFNRIDCCGDRLQNFDVILRDSSGVEVHRFGQGTGVQDIFVFTLTSSSRARYVKVQLRGTEYLQLAEVQVFSGEKTCSGTAARGSRCSFPFVYQKDTFNSCAKADGSHRRPWCATGQGVTSNFGYCLCRP